MSTESGVLSHALDKRVTGRIDDTISGFLAQRGEQMDQISPRLAPMSQAAVEFLAGGKRIRPLFCYWGWCGAGGDPADPAITRAAAALEFVQACALAHDDVMDASDTRRGKPSLHRRLAEIHKAEGRAGDPDRFGEASAILLGDLFLSWSDELLHNSGFDGERLQNARSAFDAMRTEVVAGQFLDIDEQSRLAVTAEAAQTVNRYKTAKYTVERPLHLGGVLASASPELLIAYSDFGVPVGEAFQLRDDLLGVFGDEEHTGKPSGGDITEGKHTVLVAVALQRGSPNQRKALQDSLGSEAADIDAVREILIDTGARTEVENLIESSLGQGLAALDAAHIEHDARSALTGLAIAAARRSR